MFQHPHLSDGKVDIEPRSFRPFERTVRLGPRFWHRRQDGWLENRKKRRKSTSLGSRRRPNTHVVDGPREAILRDNAHKNNKALLWVRSSTNQYDKRRTPKSGDRVQVIFRPPHFLLPSPSVVGCARFAPQNSCLKGLQSVTASGDEMNLLETAPRLAEPTLRFGSPWSVRCTPCAWITCVNVRAALKCCGLKRRLVAATPAEHDPQGAAQGALY